MRLNVFMQSWRNMVATTLLKPELLLELLKTSAVKNSMKSPFKDVLEAEIEA